MQRISILMALTLLMACRRNEPTPAGNPACVMQLIQQNGRQNTGLDFIAIYRYKYQKQYVYFGLSDCCDQFNRLLDQSCNVLCAPNGGFTGAGAGKCPNFFKEASEETLLWQRPQ